MESITKVIAILHASAALSVAVSDTKASITATTFFHVVIAFARSTALSIVASTLGGTITKDVAIIAKRTARIA